MFKLAGLTLSEYLMRDLHLVGVYEKNLTAMGNYLF
jgi:hypothetical protein